jgi:putative ABC transport system substrate-binding protein
VVTKRLELARELVPRATTIATLVNPDNPPSVTEGTTLHEAAATLGQPIQILNASTEGHIDDAFAVIVQQRIGALIVSSDPLFFIERKKLVVLTARHALPTIFADRRYHRHLWRPWHPGGAARDRYHSDRRDDG